MPMATLLTLALNYTAHVYGYSEHYCGDPHDPMPCDTAATTASGLPFDPDKPIVAVHVPAELTSRLRISPGRWQLCVLALDGTPTWLPVEDKKGRVGLDATPAAWKLLGYRPSPTHSAKLTPCAGNFVKDNHK